MRTILQSLAWKELRELRWDTLWAAIIVLVVPLFLLLRDPALAMFAIGFELMLYPLAAGIFFGMRLAASERSGRTARFVSALPVRPPVVGLVKLLTASVMILLPLVLIGVVGLGLRRAFEVNAADAQLSWDYVAASGAATLLVMTLVAAAGSGAASEVLAALRGLLALVAMWMVLALTEDWVSRKLPVSRELTPAWFAIVASVLAMALGAVYAAAFHRSLAPLREKSRRWLDPFAWSPKRFHGPLLAILWKDARQTAAASVWVLAIAVGLCLVITVTLTLPRMGQPATGGHVLTLSAELLSMFLWLGGFVLALLVGVGTVFAEVQPEANTFWRSRPISASMWYWSKYTLGQIAIGLWIGGPFLVAGAVGNFDVTERGFVWSLLLWSLAFSLAITITCLLRQPVSAGVLAIGITGLLYALVQSWFGSSLEWSADAPMAALYSVFGAALIASTLAGWWIAVRDVSLAR